MRRCVPKVPCRTMLTDADVAYASFVQLNLIAKPRTIICCAAAAAPCVLQHQQSLFVPSVATRLSRGCASSLNLLFQLPVSSNQLHRTMLAASYPASCNPSAGRHPGKQV